MSCCQQHEHAAYKTCDILCQAVHALGTVHCTHLALPTAKKWVAGGWLGTPACAREPRDFNLLPSYSALPVGQATGWRASMRLRALALWSPTLLSTWHRLWAQVAYGWLARQHAHAGLGGAALARCRMGLTELQAMVSAPAPLPANEAGMTLPDCLVLRFLSQSAPLLYAMDILLCRCLSLHGLHM
jgi:hypothetical protein